MRNFTIPSFLGVVFLFGWTSQAFCSASFADYLSEISKRSGVNSIESQFNTDIQPEIKDFFTYNADNVIILFDMSGSTRIGGSASSARRSSLNDAEILESAETQTKHIALAQLEGLSLTLKYLAATRVDRAQLYLVGFSDVAQFPIAKIEFPHTIKCAHDFYEIAKSLPYILPYPHFSGTKLTSGLEPVISKIERGNTLLIVVTDGRTDDAVDTASMLNRLSNKLANSDGGYRLDILTIGAGSILGCADAQKDSSKRRGIMTNGERAGEFTRACQSDGMECNMGYLEGITSFASPFGRGRYSGAYKDYSDLKKVLSAFFSGDDDGSHLLFVQSDKKGELWCAKHHQYMFIKAFLENSKYGETYEYNKSGFIASITRDQDSKLIQVTDVHQTTRYYLWEEASHLKVVSKPNSPHVVTVTSEIPAVQAIIDQYF